MGPLETAVNNECTDGRPYTRDILCARSHNNENKEVTSSSMTWWGYPTLQSQGNQAKAVYFPIKYEGISVFVSIVFLILGTRIKSNDSIGKFSLFSLLSLI